MSKIESLISTLQKILTKKTTSQLIQQQKKFGLSAPTKSKQAMIEEILVHVRKHSVLHEKLDQYINRQEMREKQSGQGEMKVEGKGKGKEEGKGQGESDRGVKSQMGICEKYYQVGRLDWGALRNVAALEESLVNSYAHRFGGKKIMDVIYNQLPNEVKPVIKSIRLKQNTTKPQPPQQPPQQPQSQSQPSPSHPPPPKKLATKLYFIDDTDPTKTTPEQKTQLLLKQAMLSQLNRVGIQTEIVLPRYRDLQLHQNSEEVVRGILRGQDLQSFYRYVSFWWSRQLRKMIRKEKSIYETYRLNKIQTISQGIFVIKLIKELQYNQKDQFQKFLSTVKQSQSTNTYKSKDLYQLLTRSSQYQHHYQFLLSFESPSTQIKIIQIIKQSMSIPAKQKVQQVNSMHFFGLYSFLFKFVDKLITQFKQNKVNVYSVSNSQITMDKNLYLQQIKKISEDVIFSWNDLVKNKKIYKIDQLNLILDCLRNLDDLIDTMTQIHDYNPKPIYQSQNYQTIILQTLYSMQKTFQNQNIYSNIFPANIVNRIITNFQSVFGNEEFPQQIIVNCLINAYTAFKDLQSQTMRSLVRLLSTRSVVEKKPLVLEVIESMLVFCQELDIKQTLLSIQVAISYEIRNKEIVIRNLIVNNINPDGLDENISRYLVKLVEENIVQNQIKKQILQYLK